MDHLSLALRWQRSTFTLDINLQLPSEGVTAIYGSSGAGKTSLLRCIAGLAKAPHANIQFQDHIWQQGRHFTPPERRRIGYVFQEASLLPHLSVRQNIRFARRRATQALSDHQLHELLNLMDIHHLLDRQPSALSGGELQRAAIACALAPQPQLVLMDEPLSALDGPRKQALIPYLERLKTHMTTPIIYVSHSMDEIARLADHLVVLEEGKVRAHGPLSRTLQEIHLHHTTDLEPSTVLTGKIIQHDANYQLKQVALDSSECTLWVNDQHHAVGDNVRVRIQARDVSIALQAHADTSIQNIIPATIDDFNCPSHAQSLVLIPVNLSSNSQLLAQLTLKSCHDLNLRPQQHVYLQIKSAAVIS